MIELVTVDNRKFEIIRTIKIPSRLSDEKFEEVLTGIMHLRKIVAGERYIYLVNEAMDAVFSDIPLTVDFEQRKQEILDAAEKIIDERTNDDKL